MRLINDDVSDDEEMIEILIDDEVDDELIEKLIPLREYFWDFRYSKEILTDK